MRFGPSRMRPIRTRMQLAGVRETVANLTELPRRLGKATLDRALVRVARPIADDAEGRIKRVSGQTATKIDVSTQLSRRQRRQAGPKRPGVREVYVGVRPSTVAHLIEFGTGPRYTKAGAFRGRVQPNPFMRPAWDAGKHGALDELGQILGEEIQRSAERLSRRNVKRARR